LVPSWFQLPGCGPTGPAKQPSWFVGRSSWTLGSVVSIANCIGTVQKLMSVHPGATHSSGAGSRISKALANSPRSSFGRACIRGGYLLLSVQSDVARWRRCPFKQPWLCRPVGGEAGRLPKSDKRVRAEWRFEHRSSESGLAIAGLFIVSSWVLLVFAAIADCHSPLANSFGSKPLPCLSMK